MKKKSRKARKANPRPMVIDVTFTIQDGLTFKRVQYAYELTNTGEYPYEDAALGLAKLAMEIHSKRRL